MSESGGKCLLSLANVLPVSTFLSSASEAALDPHAMCRAQAAVCVNALLVRCAGERKGGRCVCGEEVAAICELLPKLLADTSADVRAQSKAAFETLHKNWPEKGSSLVSAAPEHVQRMLSAAAAGGGGSKLARAPGKKMDIKGIRLAAMQRLKGEQQVSAHAFYCHVLSGACRSHSSMSLLLGRCRPGCSLAAAAWLLDRTPRHTPLVAAVRHAHVCDLRGLRRMVLSRLEKMQTHPSSLSLPRKISLATGYADGQPVVGRCWSRRG